MESNPVIWAYAAVVGACMGSFITLITYRLPREESIGFSRSRCPTCGVTLSLRDLIPMLSWVIHRGRCRHCSARVSVRYPLTELATMLGTLLALHLYGLSWQGLALAGLWWSIVALTVTDLEHYIILDEVQIAIIAFGLLYHWAIGTAPLDVAMAAMLGLAIGLALKYGFLALRKKDGLGLGDVKLLVGAGVWLASLPAFVPFLFFSGVLGVVFGLIWRVLSKSAIFPFGPSLAISLLLCVVRPDLAAQFWQVYGVAVTH